MSPHRLPRSQFLSSPRALALLWLLAPAWGCVDSTEDEGPIEAFRAASGPATLAANEDGDTNPRGWNSITCDYEAGEVMVGIVTYDTGWDALDGIALLCEATDGTVSQLEISNDLSNTVGPPHTLLCPAGEHVVSLGYHHLDPVPVPSDTEEAAVITCSDGSQPANGDLPSPPPAPDVVVSCPAGQLPVGFGQVDYVGPAYSDLVDALTLACADDTDCALEETVPYNEDTEGNSRLPLTHTCPEGETMIGVLFAQYEAWDSLDASGIRCQDALGGVTDVFHAGDMSTATGPQVDVDCPAGSTVTGIAYKDVDFAQVPPDAADAVTVICDGGDPLEIDELAPADNPNDYRRSECPAGAEAVGMQMIAIDGPTYSDLTEVLSVVCREMVCES